MRENESKSLSEQCPALHQLAHLVSNQDEQIQDLLNQVDVLTRELFKATSESTKQAPAPVIEEAEVLTESCSTCNSSLARFVDYTTPDFCDYMCAKFSFV